MVYVKEDFWSNKEKTDKLNKAYRADKTNISNFNKNLGSYGHNKDWTESGRVPDNTKSRPGMSVTKGLFAGAHKIASAYTVGRDKAFVQKMSKGSQGVGANQKPTLYMRPKDIGKLRGVTSHISGFAGSKFKGLASGEAFSTKPGTPIQQKIVNAYAEVNKKYNLKPSNDLKKTFQKNMSLSGGERSHMGAENLPQRNINIRPGKRIKTMQNESEHLMYRASTKHLRTYLNFMKMRATQGLATPADEEMVKKAQKHYSTRLLHNVLTSKNIKEDVNEDAPTNAAGGGAVAGIGIASPTIKNPPQDTPGINKKKRILKRFKDI